MAGALLAGSASASGECWPVPGVRELGHRVFVPEWRVVCREALPESAIQNELDQNELDRKLDRAAAEPAAEIPASAPAGRPAEWRQPDLLTNI